MAWPPRRDPGAPVAEHEPRAPSDEPRDEALVARLPTRIASRAPAPRPRYEQVAPGVHVREGEAEGLGYLEVVLGDVDPTSSLPLIVVIHGRGDRPRVPGGPFEGLSHPVRVLVPRGPIIVGSGFGWLPVVVRDNQPELLSAGLREVGDRITRLIARVRSERATIGPVILSGFSQGGMLAITMAVRHPEVAGVVFPLAGWLPPPLWPTEHAPAGAPAIRAMHATDDERIPFASTDESYAHLRGLGWDLELRAFDGVGHAMSSEMDALYHGWLEHALDAITRGDGALVEGAPAVTERSPEIQPEQARPRRPARRPRRPRRSRLRRSRPRP